MLFWHKYWVLLIDMWPGKKLAEECMPTVMEEKRYLEAQLLEIRQYIERYPNDDPNVVAHRWIDRHAASFRRRWAKKHY
ncbi:MAG: hypothetical protein HQM14_07765 [SAR324 cluster bacterium]|nr:hypothetical protein [SAR324 cluster bacterium]